MLTRVTFICIFLAGLLPSLGLVFGGLWPLALISVALGSLWLVSYRRGAVEWAPLMLVGCVALAGVGISLRGGALWAPPGLVLALAAWDLDRFTDRMRRGAVTAENHNLELQHLARLLAVSGVGLALAWAALGLRFELDMAFVLALGFFAILGLSFAIRTLVRGSD